ncbi:uncharacterized protein LOC109907384 isoform X1 [Oncorhynchus kisutch]|uniref:uncharacterized protein LOC109907384 isoform X1 n=3 Tax=Oncorhynchus kisutch TaxID=8019 RepID=UPI0009A04745|nr:uncharacterized protein LOC109907384 isoform X1 [Oncorhynchus kisutch]
MFVLGLGLHFCRLIIHTSAAGGSKLRMFLKQDCRGVLGLSGPQRRSVVFVLVLLNLTIKKTVGDQLPTSTNDPKMTEAQTTQPTTTISKLYPICTTRSKTENSQTIHTTTVPPGRDYYNTDRNKEVFPTSQTGGEYTRAQDYITNISTLKTERNDTEDDINVTHSFKNEMVKYSDVIPTSQSNGNHTQDGGKDFDDQGSIASDMTQTENYNITTEPTPTATARSTMGDMTVNAALTRKKMRSCKIFSCIGITCYKHVKVMEDLCEEGMDFCELKKASSQVTWNTYVAVWSAGCARDCRQSTKCGPFSSYQCHNECCVAGSVSCLRLDGSLNMPVNSACCGLGSLSLLALSVTSLLDNLLNTR